MSDYGKPIRGYGGYSITRDGKVYSTRNSRDGSPKLLKESRGFVRMNVSIGQQKQVKVSELIKSTWGE